MKTSVISILVMLVFATGNYGYCQKEYTRSYKVWVKLKQKNSKIMGRLVELRDTTIVVQNWNDSISQEIPIGKIDKLKFRRKGAIGMGAGIGTGAGILIGLVSGYADGDDTPNPDAWFDFSLTAEEKATGGAIGLGILGGAVGSVIGSLKKNFVIDGILQNYTDIRPDLNKYVVQ